MDNGQATRKNLKAWEIYAYVFLAAALLLSACAPSPPGTEELRKEIQALKTEVTALKEKLGELQAGQQVVLDLLKKPGLAPGSGAFPEQLPPGSQILTVSQLLAGKDRYLGTRVTVRGPAGVVMVHHKSLMLKAPEGMVEVFFGNLGDPKQVQRLSSTNLEQPVTVTGMVSLPPKGGSRLQINAEAVEF